MINNQSMGSMIVSLRKGHGMTQAELAEKMNVTDKAVSKWERDLSCPDINTLPKLAEIFHISVDELMQVQERGQEASLWEKIQNIITLVLKCIVLAMGIAVLVTSILNAIDVNSALNLTGIGLACTGILFLQNENSRK